MIDRLRQTGSYIPSLSLLAEIKGQFAGHVLLTRAQICEERAAVARLALAPLSIVPEFQSRGVGKRLMATPHNGAAALGFGTVVLVGIADYYLRFVYEPLSRYPISLPFGASDKIV